MTNPKTRNSTRLFPNHRVHPPSRILCSLFLAMVLHLKVLAGMERTPWEQLNASLFTGMKSFENLTVESISPLSPSPASGPRRRLSTRWPPSGLLAPDCVSFQRDGRSSEFGEDFQGRDGAAMEGLFLLASCCFCSLFLVGWKES